MTKKWRHWAFCAVLAIGSVVAAWSLDEFRFFQTLNLKAYDAHFVVRDYLYGHPRSPILSYSRPIRKRWTNFPNRNCSGIGITQRHRGRGRSWG